MYIWKKIYDVNNLTFTFENKTNCGPPDERVESFFLLFINIYINICFGYSKEPSY